MKNILLALYVFSNEIWYNQDFLECTSEKIRGYDAPIISAAHNGISGYVYLLMNTNFPSVKSIAWILKSILVGVTS